MKSRKRKEANRITIRWCLAKDETWMTIHDIWDDYYYWLARQAWERNHKGKSYEDFYSTHKRY